jgi:drug/metabolite transporter (DMT)-like permease
VNYTSAINASIMQASMPLIVFLAGFVLYGATVSPLQVVGFLVSVGGVAVTVSHGELGRLLELDLNVGDAIMFAAVVSYGLYTVGLRRRPPLHWQTLMFSLMVAAAVTSLPLAVVEWLRGEAGWPTARGWAIVVFVGIFPSLLSQAFYVRGVELIGGNRAGLFVNLVPIFGTLLSILLLGEEFHPYHALALLLVLGGIALAEVAAQRRNAATGKG